MKRGYYAHVLGEADHHFKDPVEALKLLKVRKQLPHFLPEIAMPSLRQNRPHGPPALPSPCPHHQRQRTSSRRSLLNALKQQETDVRLWLPV